MSRLAFVGQLKAVPAVVRQEKSCFCRYLDMEALLQTIKQKNKQHLLNLLSRNGREKGCLVKLMEDEQSFALLLEDDRLWESVRQGSFRGTPELLFFLLVQQMLKERKEDSSELQSYLTRLLLQMNREQQKAKEFQWVALLKGWRRIFSLSLDGDAIFSLLRGLGDKTLFMSSFFPEYIERRLSTSLSLCEEVGSFSYRTASLTERAYHTGLAEPLFQLSREFARFRELLTKLSTLLQAPALSAI